MKLSKLTKPELERISNNANFTEEEQKIFWLISQGKNLQEIACRLSLSKSTVSRRLKDIQDKIDLFCKKYKLSASKNLQILNQVMSQISNELNESN